MSQDLPSFASLGSDAPVYLRMLRRRSQWPADGDPLTAAAAEDAAMVIFADRPCSLYRVACDADLCYSAAALRARSHDPTDQLDLLGVDDSDLRACEITVEPDQDRGRIYCPQAAGLHFHAALNDDQVRRLGRRLASRQRRTLRISKRQLQTLKGWLAPLGCGSYARAEQPDCRACR